MIFLSVEIDDLFHYWRREKEEGLLKLDMEHISQSLVKLVNTLFLQLTNLLIQSFYKLQNELLGWS